MGAICHRSRGYRALTELDQTTLVLEIDLSQTVLEEWILACPPNEPLIISLVQETLEDIRTIIEA